MEKDNILVITLGRRDVQINEHFMKSNGLRFHKHELDYFIVDEMSGESIDVDLKQSTLGNVDEGSYALLHPRMGGEIILRNEKFKASIDFPIVRPVFEKLKSEGVDFSYIILVYTDQSDPKFRNGDTLFFSSLMAEYFSKNYGLFVDEYPIHQGLIDIDVQYKGFKLADKNENERLLPLSDSINKVYLLAQGGIDQVNFALTLRLIESFPNKLIYLHKAEKTEVVVREFPSLFYKNLTRNQIISLIQRREFRGPQTLLISETLIHLCKLAQATIDLNYIEIDELIKVDLSKPYHFYDEFRKEYNSLSKSKKILLLLFVSLKNDFFKQDPNGMVWKFQTLAEQMFRPEVEQILDLKSDASDNQISDALKSSRFQFLLRFILKENKDLKDKIEKKPTTVIKSDYKLYASIIKFNLEKNSFANDSIHFQMIKAFDRIKDRRVKLIHYGHFSTMEDLSKKLLHEQKSIKEFIDLISTYLASMGITLKTSRIIDKISEFSLKELTS